MTLSRRGLLSVAALMPAATSLPSLAAGNALEVRSLKANALTDPMGLDDQAVRLSWQLVSATRNTLQTSYRVKVASTAEGLKAGQYDLWDSGVISSDQSFDIIYRGQRLKSRAQAFWQVTVTDNHGHHATSPVARWEMALLDPADWTARWIAAEDAEQRADRETGLIWVSGGRAPDKSHRLFRLKFTLAQAANTTVLAIANNNYDLFIDGQAIPQPPTGEPRFGKAELVETPINLAAGDHVVALKVRDPDGFLAMYQPEIATGLMIRAGGQRISSAGTKTALGEPVGWTTTTFNDSGWETAGKAAYQMEAFPGKGAFLLRRDFEAKTVVSARLYASALGAYETWINSARVGDALLTPESSDFRDHALYRVYDVTKMIRNGENTIGALVGDGWYGSYNAPAGRFAYGPPPLRYIAQLEMIYSDGSKASVITDENWSIAPSPITSSEIYNGETYDARREIPGWSEPGKNTDWQPVHLAPIPPCVLKAQSSPPIRRTQTLTAKSIKKMDNDNYVFDFGQNFAGWARLKAMGEAGETVTLRFAEVLLADGHVDQSNLRAARATDIYILKGDPKGETFEPHFTYHGFRYVEVSGYPGIPGGSDITGIVIHSDLPETSHLRIGNPIIQQLWQNALWSQRSNFVGLPTDCPQRDERLGWMGDAGVFWDTAAFNMDVTAFTQRFMGDVRDTQSPDGAFPDFAPNTWDAAWGAYGASPGWADAGIILPWTVWKRAGDTAIIDQNWPAMTAYLAFLKTNNPDFIWANQRGHDYGDWLALDAKEPGDPTTPKDLVATAMWKQSADMMTEMARATGRDATPYASTADAIKIAFNKAFVRADGSIGNGSQTGYILALKYGLVPDDLRAAAAAHLVADIERRGMLLSTGFLGTPSSLDVLSDAGYDDIVYNLLLRTTFPSWGYMVAKGATTIWERWNADTGDVSMNSFNHYALGAVNGFVFRRIAGLSPSEPGFRTFVFDPVLDPRVKTGGGDYDSVLGRISTDWAQTAQGFTLDITVPANGRAILHLPGTQVSEGGKPVKTTIEDGKSRLEIGSGRYRLLSR